jgi:serine/threonine protein kinase
MTQLRDTRQTSFRGKLGTRPFATSYALTGELLGTGGYGVVWRGRELATSLDVAVKVVPLSTACTHDRGKEGDVNVCKYRKRYHGLSELETMAELSGRCPGLLGLKEAFIEEGKLFLVMKVMATDLCDELMSRETPYSEDEVRLAMHNLFVGIRHCHSKGIAHRDVKLDNIFLKTKGDISSARLGDFGLAHKSSWGAVRGASGSIQYMAPEVASSTHASPGYDALAADMWSLGVVMFGLLAKRFPFGGNSNAELKEAIYTGKYEIVSHSRNIISAQAKDLLQKLLTLDPKARCTATEALNHEWFDAILLQPRDGSTVSGIPNGLKPIQAVRQQQHHCSQKSICSWKASINFRTIMKRAGLSSPVVSDRKETAKMPSKMRSPFARITSSWYIAPSIRHASYKESSSSAIGVAV